MSTLWRSLAGRYVFSQPFLLTAYALHDSGTPRMDRLWSPWRAEHLDHDAPAAPAGTTLFARLAAEGRDADNLILWRGAHVFVLLNLYPYNNGHLLIAPYRAVADYDALTSDEQADLFTTLHRALGWLRAALAPDGFNVGMNLGSAAGAGVPDHLHLHVVPRWSADTNFMPVVGETKVLPESLEATYRRLRAVIEAEPARDDG